MPWRCRQIVQCLTAILALVGIGAGANSAPVSATAPQSALEWWTGAQRGFSGAVRSKPTLIVADKNFPICDQALSIGNEWVAIPREGEDDSSAILVRSVKGDTGFDSLDDYFSNPNDDDPIMTTLSVRSDSKSAYVIQSHWYPPFSVIAVERVNLKARNAVLLERKSWPRSIPDIALTASLADIPYATECRECTEYWTGALVQPMFKGPLTVYDGFGKIVLRDTRPTLNATSIQGLNVLSDALHYYVSTQTLRNSAKPTDDELDIDKSFGFEGGAYGYDKGEAVLYTYPKDGPNRSRRVLELSPGRWPPLPFPVNTVALETRTAVPDGRGGAVYLWRGQSAWGRHGGLPDDIVDLNVLCHLNGAGKLEILDFEIGYSKKATTNVAANDPQLPPFVETIPVNPNAPGPYSAGNRQDHDIVWERAVCQWTLDPAGHIVQHLEPDEHGPTENETPLYARHLMRLYPVEVKNGILSYFKGRELWTATLTH